MIQQHNEDYLSRAYELARLKRFDLALQEVQRALERDPQSADAHVCGAWIWRDQVRLSEAEQSARAALRLDPDSAPAHHILAVVLWEQDRPREAEPAFREALRFGHPDQAIYITNFGRMMNAYHRSEEALTLADQALTLAPNLSGAHDVRGLALARLGRQDEARASYGEALRLNPSNTVAHNNMGVLDLSQGRASEALEHFRSALRINPNDTLARSNLVLSLKARRPIYGWIVALSLRMRTQRSRRARRQLVLGALGLVLGAAALSLLIPGLNAPLAIVWGLTLQLVLGGLVLVVLWRWLGDPIFNTLLRFDPLGRQVIQHNPIDTAVTACFAVLVLGVLLRLGLGLALGGDHPLAGLGGWLAISAALGLVFSRPLYWMHGRGLRFGWVGYLMALGGFLATSFGVLTDASIFACLSLLLLTPGLLLFAAGVALSMIQPREARG
ncbi:MAG TPA: tetratricopeptide repeat protein [Roseiflexaceae bacterium]|nr:tetratricopeptide repeat protein [Roseiflexaceae bacterium]